MVATAPEAVAEGAAGLPEDRAELVRVGIRRRFLLRTRSLHNLLVVLDLRRCLRAVDTGIHQAHLRHPCWEDQMTRPLLQRPSGSKLKQQLQEMTISTLVGLMDCRVH